MRPKLPLPGDDLEYSVLLAVWDSGRASARDVHRRVGESRGLAYTTIAKVLERLRAKGLVTRKRVGRGRAFWYRARVGRAVLERRRVRELLRRLLGPEPRPAVAMLVDAVEALDPELLDEMARAVEVRRSSRRAV